MFCGLCAARGKYDLHGLIEVLAFDGREAVFALRAMPSRRKSMAFPTGPVSVQTQ